MLNTTTDIGDELLDLRHRLMHHSQQNPALASVIGHPAKRAQKLGSTRDGLHAILRICKPHVPAPPVVDQRHRPCAQRATFDVVCAVTAPAPLILDFIKAVLAVSAVAIELPHVLELVRRIAHKDCVFPILGRLVLVDQCQFGLLLDVALATPSFSRFLLSFLAVNLARSAYYDNAPL